MFWNLAVVVAHSIPLHTPRCLPTPWWMNVWGLPTFSQCDPRCCEHRAQVLGGCVWIPLGLLTNCVCLQYTIKDSSDPSKLRYKVQMAGEVPKRQAGVSRSTWHQRQAGSMPCWPQRQPTPPGRRERREQQKLGAPPSVDDEAPTTSPPNAREPLSIIRQHTRSDSCLGPILPAPTSGCNVPPAVPTRGKDGKPTPSHFCPQPHCSWPRSSPRNTHHSCVTQDHTPSSAASYTKQRRSHSCGGVGGWGEHRHNIFLNVL